MSKTVDAVKKNLKINQNMPLKQSIYYALRKTIILGEISAGVRINEKEFSDSLNISRTPIRYALDELEKENLVEYIPRTGCVVKGISIADAHEIYDIRKALDTLATIKAFQNMTEEDFAELESLLKEGDRLNELNDVDAVLKNFSDFNHFIYEKSRMIRLGSIVTKLQAYLVYFRDIAIRASERRSLALKEHWLIYRGMKNKDIDQITLITHEHLDRSLQFILQEMERRKIE
ncbi:GntR family transcriptional regulator [Ignavigranum ruoffiae]|uniref:GntR family transcriptional regulator n=1 Tax=Ignavigranum ruoffiae TaxID=89093 RepID=UPI0024ADB02A|nr:GntR family transcriptional regulator [Ignavigranum ruoffiae]